MSTIGQLRAADKRVKDILNALKGADAQDQDQQDRLGAELKSATDGARAEGREAEPGHRPANDPEHFRLDNTGIRSSVLDRAN